MFNFNHNSKKIISLIGIIFFITILAGCGGGGGGTSAVTPVTDNTATFSGTVSPVVPTAPGVLAPALQVAGENFDVTLVDATTGTEAAASDLDSTTPNATVSKTAGDTYNFKVKNLNKSYKIIAKSKTRANKILSTFLGLPSAGDKITGKNIDEKSTVIGMMYGDASRAASAFKTIETQKASDAAFINKINTYMANLEQKRTYVSQQTFTNLGKLEEAYKDLLFGTTDASQIQNVVKGLEASLVAAGSKTLRQELDEALALIGTESNRQNKTNIEDCMMKLFGSKTSDTANALDGSLIKKAQTANDAAILNEAKIAFSTACNYMGNLYKNGVVSSSQAGAAMHAPNLMAAYQVTSETNADAMKWFKKGYTEIKNLLISSEDANYIKASAVILKNATEVAKEDPAALEEAKRKADALIAKLNATGQKEIILPSGEKFKQEKIYEKKGEALINGKRPAEAVQVFNQLPAEDTNAQKIKNFGLGRAYLELNDLKQAYQNMKEAVKDVVKAANQIETRMEAEKGFEKINEALFAFAAVIDKVKNDAAVKNQIIEEEKAKPDAKDKFFVNTQNQAIADSEIKTVVVVVIVQVIKPDTAFREIADNVVNNTSSNFSDYANVIQSVNVKQQEFDAVMLKLVNINSKIDYENSKATKNIADLQTLVYGANGSVTAPAEGSLLKQLNDASAKFLEIYNAVNDTEGVTIAEVLRLKGEAYYQYASTFMIKYRALELIQRADTEIRNTAKNHFLFIKVNLDKKYFAHLTFTVGEMLRNIEEIERTLSGINQAISTALAAAYKVLGNAESFYLDGDAAANAEFIKAFDLFNAIYKNTSETADNQKIALYFTGYCKYYQFLISKRADSTLKNAGIERLKLFLLKYPKSEFAENAQNLINDMNSTGFGTVAIQTGVAADPAVETPGADFEKAMAAFERLRFMYKTNASSSEIESVFTTAEVIFKSIADGLTKEVELGTIGKTANGYTVNDTLIHFRANARFQLALLYMERYNIPVVKNVKYKSLALQYFNELLLRYTNEPFIASVNQFTYELNNEGAATVAYDSNMPIFTSVVVSPAFIDRNLVKTDAKIKFTADVTVPEAVNGGAKISTVSVEIKQFDRPVTDANNKPIIVHLARKAGTATVWEGEFNVPANAAIGQYDLYFKASTNDTPAKTVYYIATYVIKGDVQTVQIENVWIESDNALNNIFKVKVNALIEDGKYTGVFADVMQQFDSGLMPVKQNIKLDTDSVVTENTKYTIFKLNQAEKLPTLATGTYLMIFKAVKYDPLKPTESLNAPLHAVPFNFFYTKDAGTDDKQAVLAKYNEILVNFNNKQKTAADRVNAFSAMYNTPLNTAWKTAFTSAFEVLGSSILIEKAPNVEVYVEYINDNMLAVHAPWNLSGIYTKQTAAIFFPDGNRLLPAGLEGFYFNEMVDGSYKFIKVVNSNGVNEWKIYNEYETAQQTVTQPVGVKITKIAGKTVPAAGVLDISDIVNIPLIAVEGANLNPNNVESQRILQLVGSSPYPIVMAKTGDVNWTDSVVKFNNSVVTGLKGEWTIELIDTKFGVLQSVPVTFGTPQVNVELYPTFTSIMNGTAETQIYNITEPININTKEVLVIKGLNLNPASGKKYKLMAFNKAYVGTASSTIANYYIELLSTDTTDINNYWNTGEIKVSAAKMADKLKVLPASNIESSLVIFEYDAVTAPMPKSMPIPVFFKDSTINTSAMPVMLSVNNIPVTTTINLEKTPAQETMEIIVKGANFMSLNKRRLDLVFQYYNQASAVNSAIYTPVHVTIAVNFDPATMIMGSVNWQNDMIKGKVNFKTALSLADGKTVEELIKANYPVSLLIWDENTNRSVTNMVPVSFFEKTESVPYLEAVNGVKFYGNPIVVNYPADGVTAEIILTGKNLAKANTFIYAKPVPTTQNPNPAAVKLSFNASPVNEQLKVLIEQAKMPVGVYGLALVEELQTGALIVSNGLYINVKKTGVIDTTLADNFAVIQNVKRLRDNLVMDTANVEFTVGDTTAVIMGRNFKTSDNVLRSLMRRSMPTEFMPYPEPEYVKDVYSSGWTNYEISIDISQAQPGTFEVYIYEPISGKIVSNVVKVVIKPNANAPAINTLNGTQITPAVPFMLNPFMVSTLIIEGKNFGTVQKQVMFQPYPDQYYPNPLPLQLYVTEWSDNKIIVTGFNNIMVFGGELYLAENVNGILKTLTTSVPVSIDRGTTGAVTPKYVTIAHGGYEANTKKVFMEFANNNDVANTFQNTSIARMTPNEYTLLIDQIVVSKKAANAVINAEHGLKDNPADRYEIFGTENGNAPLVFYANGTNSFVVDPSMLKQVPADNFDYLIISFRKITGKVNDNNQIMDLTETNEAKVLGMGLDPADSNINRDNNGMSAWFKNNINFTGAYNKLRLEFQTKDTVKKMLTNGIPPAASAVYNFNDIVVSTLTMVQTDYSQLNFPVVSGLRYEDGYLKWDNIVMSIPGANAIPYRVEIDGNIMEYYNNSYIFTNFFKLSDIGINSGYHNVRVGAWLPGTTVNQPMYGPFGEPIGFEIMANPVFIPAQPAAAGKIVNIELTENRDTVIPGLTPVNTIVGGTNETLAARTTPDYYGFMIDQIVFSKKSVNGSGLKDDPNARVEIFNSQKTEGKYPLYYNGVSKVSLNAVVPSDVFDYLIVSVRSVNASGSFNGTYLGMNNGVIPVALGIGLNKADLGWLPANNMENMQFNTFKIMNTMDFTDTASNMLRLEFMVKDVLAKIHRTNRDGQQVEEAEYYDLVINPVVSSFQGIAGGTVSVNNINGNTIPVGTPLKINTTSGITINGTGFGTRGANVYSGRQLMFRPYNSTIIEILKDEDILSWSDTQIVIKGDTDSTDIKGGLLTIVDIINDQKTPLINPIWIEFENYQVPMEFSNIMQLNGVYNIPNWNDAWGTTPPVNLIPAYISLQPANPTLNINGTGFGTFNTGDQPTGNKIVFKTPTEEIKINVIGWDWNIDNIFSQLTTPQYAALTAAPGGVLYLENLNGKVMSNKLFVTFNAASGNLNNILDGVGVSNGVIGWNRYAGQVPQDKPYLFYTIKVDGQYLMNNNAMPPVPLALIDTNMTKYTYNLITQSGVSTGMHTVEVEARVSVSATSPLNESVLVAHRGIFANVDPNLGNNQVGFIENMAVTNNMLSWSKYSGSVPQDKPYVFYVINVDGQYITDVNATPPVPLKIMDNLTDYNFDLVAQGRLLGGSHTVEVEARAALSGTSALIESVLLARSTTNANISGATISVVNNILNWPRYAGVMPQDKPYLFYMIKVDGNPLMNNNTNPVVPMRIPDLNMPANTFDLVNNGGVTAGSHTFKVEAYAAVSSTSASNECALLCQSDMITAEILINNGGGAPTIPQVTGLVQNGNIVSWQPVTYTGMMPNTPVDGYNINIDGTWVAESITSVNVDLVTGKQMYPSLVTTGTHTMKVRAYVNAVGVGMNAPTYGPESAPVQIQVP
ncbi:MAG: hypothetical protein QMC67_10960 [Candidatus Wallbacteria bacterium]